MNNASIYQTTLLVMLLSLAEQITSAWTTTEWHSERKYGMTMSLRVSERCLSTPSATNREFKGRLGHLKPKLWSTTATIDHTKTKLHAEHSNVMKFKTFEEMLTQYTDIPVVVNFHNHLCGPCKLMRKELNVVSDTLKEDIKMFAVDTELYPKLGQRYQVSGLPTVMIFHHGTVRERIEGLHSSDEIIRRIQGLL
jgi:thioredoxin 1